ncbi:MAG TPA: class I SAM-dependent methyltransferase [Candidatus Sulfotelmatobacter sp.]|nr:class I SAM-dependent methyltransferase [Candidatus Sulfotelmatobacter sp.]
MATPPDNGVSFSSAFARHWRSSVRYYGLRQTIMQVSSGAYRFLRELLPDRRKMRYSDLDYDFAHMVDTTRANVSFRAQLIAALSAHQYFPSEPWLFEQIMQAPPVSFKDFTFIDLGSGKGRALLMAAAYGFKRITGIEFMPEWHRVAVDNIRKYTAEHETTAAIESLCMDARDFDFPNEPLVIYLFNPFPEPVLARVLDKLRGSLLRNPRPVFVAYRYPEYERLFLQSGWLERIAGTEQWAVYKDRAKEEEL